MQKTYICKYCNKQYSSNESRNGHQTWCKSNPNVSQTKLKISSTLRGVFHNIEESNKVNYKRLCQKCNNQYDLFISKRAYELGQYKKYCSRSCANSRQWNEQDKQKISTSCKNSSKVKVAAKIRSESYKKPKYKKNCPICGSQFYVTEKGSIKKYCKWDCYKLHTKILRKTPVCAGYNHGGGVGKSGWYKGIWCDSSWQLAYVLYCLDHKIQIKRNKQAFPYMYNKVQYLYYPDFQVQGQLVEIKGYKDKKWNYKLSQCNNLKIIDSNSIQLYLQYSKSKYGNNFITLYQ